MNRAGHTRLNHLLKGGVVLMSVLLIVSIWTHFKRGPDEVWKSKTYKVPPVPPAMADGIHPRLLITPSDLRELRSRTRADYRDAYISTIWSWFTTDGNHGGYRSAFPADAALALLYALDPDGSLGIVVKAGDGSDLTGPVAGRMAVARALADLREALTATDENAARDAVNFGAIVYDWCYPLLTAQDKATMIDGFKSVINSPAFVRLSPGLPIRTDAIATVSHAPGWIARALMPAGIAVYNEDSSIYSEAARFYFTKMLPYRDFIDAGDMNPIGSDYGNDHNVSDLLLAWYFKRLGRPVHVNPEMGRMEYSLLYNLRPDGRVLYRGDIYDPSSRFSNAALSLLLAGSYFTDGHYLQALRTLSAKDFIPSLPTDDDWKTNFYAFLLLPADPALRDFTADFPLTWYYPSPMGEMTMRTGWDLDWGAYGQPSANRDAIIQMRIGGYFVGNHQRKDMGTFQIYYKGPLAVSSGFYENGGGPATAYGGSHWLNYYHQTVSQNGLLIDDPNEPAPTVDGRQAVNDGGQVWPNGGVDQPQDLETILQNGYRQGRVTAHEAGGGADPKRPAYSYIGGDITAAYYPGKTDRVTRDMVALNTGNRTYPAAFVVFDRVNATDKSYTKKWLIHSMTDPIVDASRKTIVITNRQYARRINETVRFGENDGKLFVQNLLPRQASLTKVQGFQAGGQTFAATPDETATQVETAPYRVEISPEHPADTDYFLNGMVVMDSGAANPDIAGIASSGNVAGVQVLDRVIVFSKRASGLRSKAAFTVSGAGTFNMLVTGLKSKAWIVKKDGAIVARLTASSAGKCISFSGPAGHYTISPQYPILVWLRGLFSR